MRDHKQNAPVICAVVRGDFCRFVLNKSGERIALYCSLESLQNVSDVGEAMRGAANLIRLAVVQNSALSAMSEDWLVVIFVRTPLFVHLPVRFTAILG